MWLIMKKKRIDISNLNLYKNIFLNILFGTSLYLELFYWNNIWFFISYYTISNSSTDRPLVWYFCYLSIYLSVYYGCWGSSYSIHSVLEIIDIHSSDANRIYNEADMPRWYGGHQSKWCHVAVLWDMTRI